MQIDDNLNYMLPLGNSGFDSLRENKQIYVDKTDLLYELASLKRSYFLSRPRRFGKTLLVNTFESLFKDGLKYFKGLAIESKWADTTYPVIHLDFSSCTDFNSIEEFKDEFLSILKDAAFAANLKFPSPYLEDPDSAQARFKRMFNTLGSSSIVLLIDEYDAPLNHCLHNPKLFSQVSAELNRFYMVVKQCSPHLRFLFITGICRYKNLGIFSGMNFITDISLDSDYGTLLGYTEDELRKYFKPYIERASEVLGLSFEEVLKTMAQHYDGYCFDSDASTHVFTPWSVLNFLNKPKKGFENYWYDSAGRPTVLLNYIKSHSLRAPSEYGQDQVILKEKLDSSQGLEDISDLSLLTQAGYLTIKNVDEGNGALTLNYPNIEVSRSMSFLYSEELFHNNETAWISISPLRLFSKKDVDDIVKHINVLLGSIDYTQYPIKDEASLRCIMQVYLISGGITGVDIEKHNAFGRSDLEFKAGDKYYVIELKYAKEKDDAQKLLETAKAQIKDKHYGESSYPELKHIHLALVFSGKDRQFCAWESF